MTVPPHRPRLSDIQPPKLYTAGATLRRGYPLGPADTREEERLRGLLEGKEPTDDPEGEEVTRFSPGKPMAE
ncbi:hypothetical protein [Sphingomonas sp.]|uniref:hypothetical protein n=1 Tax=Sphingomonas sp. TaxID=28214 RepID=UPI003AFF6864